MDQTSPLIVQDHLLAVYDLENFGRISQKLALPALFGLMNDLQIMTVETLQAHQPLVIKNNGDANFMVFSADDFDARVKALLKLKETIEAHLKNKGFTSRASFSAHCGEVAVGLLGKEPFLNMDAFGEAVSVTFLMNAKPFRGRFNISPQLFRKLDSATRKIFHKFTPPITYLAD
jgi:class 3 adenylate cyclase